jgi:anaerobic ribonucleoside-triphosphate reductase activating protein
MQIRLSGPLEHDSIVNGDGLRAVLWTQGCLQHCPGCQNPETWDLEAGILVDIEEVEARLREFKGQQGITFCGGEPFLQPAECYEVAKYCKDQLGWDIWSFSGYTYEKLVERGEQDDNVKKFLHILDALIDGPFILKERDLTMKFRGSRNQRLLYLKNGKITRVE